MNVDNQTILHIKAGQVPEKELLELILATKPNAFGFAVQEPDGGDMQVVREDGSNLDIANIMEFMDGRKANPTSIYFGTLASGYNVEDIQPFDIKDPDDNTFMTIFTEGSLVGHDDPQDRTEQFNFVNGIIIPKIIEWCEDFAGDIDKIMAKINGEVFNKDFLANVSHRSVLHILPFKGDAVVLGPNQLGGEFDWGWTSRTHGFGETKQEPVAVEPKKTGYWSRGKKTVVGATTIVDVTKTEPPKDVATKGATGPRTSVPDTKKTTATSAPEVYVRPPSWLHKNDDVKQFYCLIGDTTSAPAAWKKKIPVQVKANHSLLLCNSYEEYTKWKLENLLNTTGAVGSSAPAITNEQKQQMTKQERLAAKAEGTAAPVEMPVVGPVDPTPLPIIEPKDLEKVLDFVAKHLDGSSREIIPPAEMQKLEAPLPVFSEAVGVTLAEMLNWPVSGLFGLAATDPRAMVLWGLQWRAYARPYLQAELKAKAKDGHSTTADKPVTKTTVTGGTTKTESIAAPAASAKKNSWGYGKNKAA